MEKQDWLTPVSRLLQVGVYYWYKNYSNRKSWKFYLEQVEIILAISYYGYNHHLVYLSYIKNLNKNVECIENGRKTRQNWGALNMAG